MEPRMRITRHAADHAVVVELIDEVQAEYIRRYGGPDRSPFDPQEFAPGRGAMFVVLLDDAPVAMAGWRSRPDLAGIEVAASVADRPAEIKRMYVRPAQQRRGHARALLTHLETTARAAGHDALVLETGTAQPEALALYSSAGYQPIARYGHYACSSSSRHLGKPLRALVEQLER